MKNTWILGVALISSVAFGQKKNETSAAVEYKNKFLPAFRSEDNAAAKKSILTAKEFIDLAAAHEDTKNSAKTQYLKGEIYIAIMALGQKSNDPELLEMTNEDMMKQAQQALKASYEGGKKYQSSVEEAVYRARVYFDQTANNLYNEDKFAEASDLYAWQAKFGEITGTLDSNAVFFSSVCAEKAEQYDVAAAGYYKMAKAGFKGPVTYNLAAGAFRKNEQIDRAKEVIAEGRELYPTDRDLLLELVNINIDANDPEGAEAALQAAIASDPDNKQLHYTIGTIYIEMKQNEKAEEALMKALELDPEYTLAQYQLGAHLVSWAGDLRTEASNLDFGDARYDILNAQSEEVYKRAVGPLEKYIAKNPEDKPVLNILFQLHRNLGNSEKALEYKKRADAL